MLKTLIKANKRIPSFVLLLLIILFWSFTGQQIPDKLINSISEVVPTTKEVLVSKNKVKRVIDGDTIELENGQKVRYIGIDTPERNECFNKQATAKNK
jgi:micrococcal nuclease